MVKTTHLKKRRNLPSTHAETEWRRTNHGFLRNNLSLKITAFILETAGFGVVDRAYIEQGRCHPTTKGGNFPYFISALIILTLQEQFPSSYKMQ